MYNPKLLKPYLKAKFDNNIEVKNKELYLLCSCEVDDQKSSVRALKSKFLKEFRNASNGETNGETNDDSFIKKSNDYTNDPSKVKFHDQSTPNGKEHIFFRLFKIYNNLPFYLRQKSIDLYFRIKNSESEETEEEEEGEFSYFITLFHLYDCIDENHNPEVFNDEFYLKQEMEYIDNFMMIHSWYMYKKEVEKLTSEELEELNLFVSQEKAHSLELLQQLEEKYTFNNDPLKIKCDILCHEFILNLSYFNCPDGCDDSNVKKELSYLFKFYNKVYPDEPRSYNSFVEEWFEQTGQRDQEEQE